MGTADLEAQLTRHAWYERMHDIEAQLQRYEESDYQEKAVSFVQGYLHDESTQLAAKSEASSDEAEESELREVSHTLCESWDRALQWRHEAPMSVTAKRADLVVAFALHAPFRRRRKRRER